MTDEDARQEELVEAKETLTRAVQAFIAVCDGPLAYVDGYVLVTHKLTPESEQAGQSVVGTLVGTGQSFALTRGLLEVALDSVRK